MSKHTRYLVLRTDVPIPHYWAGGGIWTTNPADAIRFYHKSDASTSFTLDRLIQDGHIQITVVHAFPALLTHRIEETSPAAAPPLTNPQDQRAMRGTSNRKLRAD